MTQIEHTPVLAGEIAELARNRTRIVDATAGAGGHLELFLGAGASVLAIDRDPEAIRSVQDRFGRRVSVYVNTPYDDLAAVAAVEGFAPDCVLLDLGVSSHQLNVDERGFTFRGAAPLDMRMSRSGPTAADVLNNHSVPDLQRVFREYGDEPRSKALAREIERRRATEEFTVSDDLVRAIRGALGARTGPGDFARLFQAVRIEVNGELRSLERALPAFRDALVPGGILVAITYHSGEDRIVKHAFREWARRCVCPPRFPICACRGVPLGVVRTKRPITPCEDELANNSRARSAKLRIFEKRDATQG